MIPARRIFIALAVTLAFAGCVTVDEDARAAISALRRGHDAAAIQWSEELARESSYSRRLGEVEAGRVNQLAGRLEASEAWFRQAIDAAIDRQEAQPKIKIGDVGNTLLASTITDDRTRQYELAPYELNLALEYAILTQEALGRREDALVDARLAVYVQDTLAETYGADVVKESVQANASTKSLSAQSDAAMIDLMAETRNSWENPVLWWLTGILFEANGEADQACQSYRKAAAIRPDNPFFRSDAVRTASRSTLPRNRSRLVIICGEGFVAGRESLKVPVPLYTAMSIDIPRYSTARYQPRAITVTENGRPGLAASPALNILSLACRDLSEHLPGIITRNVTRAATAAAAQAAVNQAGNEYAQLAVLLFNTAATAIRKADTRSWRTLPMGEQVWSDANLTPGEHIFTVSFGTSARTFKVNLKPGATEIVYINSREN